jgi:hypothetical protein
MSNQENLDRRVSAIQAEIVDLNTAVAAVKTAMDAAKAANPTIDWTELDQAISDLTNATDSVQGLVPPAPQQLPAP